MLLRYQIFPYMCIFFFNSVFLTEILSQEKGDTNKKILIEFTDKGPNGLGLSGVEYQNLPLDSHYIDQIKKCGLKIRAELRWQNKVSGIWNVPSTHCLDTLPIIKSITQFPPEQKTNVSNQLSKIQLNQKSTEFTSQPLWQILHSSLLDQAILQKKMLPGAGINIAVIDNGFNLQHQAFEHLDSTKILDAWDFVEDDSNPYVREISHGSKVLSLIVGKSSDSRLGYSPYSNLLLYRTEIDSTESYREEDLTAAAIERATEEGAHIINISLGYRYDFDNESDHPFSYFDGRHSPASVAATLAAERGVLLAIAMGNEQNLLSKEPTITAPADALGILAVGASDVSGKACDFSSTGPTYDQRPKPEVYAPGCQIPIQPSDPKAIYSGEGTSFSAPLVAGVSAVLKQYFPEATIQELRQAIMSGSQVRKQGTVNVLDINSTFQILSPQQIQIRKLYSEPYFYKTLVKQPNLVSIKTWNIQGQKKNLTSSSKSSGVVVGETKTIQEELKLK